MRSGQFYDKLADLSLYMYKHPYKDFRDWKFLEHYSDNSGLFIEVFDIGNGETLFSIKGTDTTLHTGIRVDLNSDIQILTKDVPEQANRAQAYFNSIKYKYSNIIFTGYSLGGSICQILGNRFGNETITISALAVGSFESPNNTSNIINFGCILDPFFKIDINNHLGNIYLIPNKLDNKNVGLIYWHMYPNFGKPSRGVKVNKPINVRSFIQDIQNGVETGRQIKNYIHKGIVNTNNKIQDKSKQVQNIITKYKN